MDSKYKEINMDLNKTDVDKVFIFIVNGII